MARTVALDLLENIQIASPCTADWEAMEGDERARLCGECKLRVYNISSLTADEAAELIGSAEGGLCLRLYRRADGTVLTKDCPVGLRRLRIKAAKAVGRIAAAASFLVGGGIAFGTGQRDGRLPRLSGVEPFTTIRSWISPRAAQSLQGRGQFLMGSVCPAPPPTPPGGTP